METDEVISLKKENNILKRKIRQYEYCFNKMNGQVTSYWSKCDYCGHDIYEYDPSRHVIFCNECEMTVCDDGCTDSEGTHNCFTDAGWKVIYDSPYCNNCSGSYINK